MNPLWPDIARDASIELTTDQLDQLDRYLDLLIVANQKMNLTRITDRTDAEIKHVADSLTLLKYIPPSTDRPLWLADVGTGGGIPGVILAIARPDVRVTLIDSTKKKLDAVMYIVEGMGLKNVKALHARMESVELKFDVITARAVGPLNQLLEWCRPLMRHNSILLAMKGPKITEEIEALDSRHVRQFEIGVKKVEYAALDGHVIARIKKK
ncbi:MAG TPA: 16S rRNA (guanine(527)-N(7))-methyltransferase RsmG [Tepidisphaeraceae bacterium]|nr:16S rRNA (guanine(527)-N(7))-methyltransferase RsmG [Tepidisphaeraceae bacterium]